MTNEQMVRETLNQLNTVGTQAYYALRQGVLVEGVLDCVVAGIFGYLTLICVIMINAWIKAKEPPDLALVLVTCFICCLAPIALFFAYSGIYELLCPDAEVISRLFRTVHN